MANHIRKKRIEKNIYAYFDFMEKHGIPVVQVARHSSLRSDFARERRAVDESIRLKYTGQYIYIYIHIVRWWMVIDQFANEPGTCRHAT